MALALQAMADSGLTIADLVRRMPRYSIVKMKIGLTGEDPRSVLRLVADHYADRSPDLTDGVKVDWSDRWVHVRPSNTEPVIRVIAEAPTQEEAADLCEGTVREIGSLLQRRL